MAHKVTEVKIRDEMDEINKRPANALTTEGGGRHSAPVGTLTNIRIKNVTIK